MRMAVGMEALRPSQNQPLQDDAITKAHHNFHLSVHKIAT